MKVMLIDPNLSGTHGYEVVFPFGYSSLGGVLQHNGYEVEYVFPLGGHITTKGLCDRISNTDADLIGIGGLLPNLPEVIELSKIIKSIHPDVPLLLGGQMVTYTPELALKLTGADFCIVGEGEIALLNLVDCLVSGEEWSHISGLVFQRDGKLIHNGEAEIMPLGSIPIPKWDDFPMDYYMYAGSRLPFLSDGPQKRSFTWLLSRGCPMMCNFCASGCAPRYKTITQSITELEEITTRFDPDYISFVDNLFTRNKKHTFELCQSFIDEGFRFEFSASSRADLIDPQLLDIMRRAGCRALFYGLESANDNILRTSRKGITVAQMQKAIDMTKQAGIYPMVSIMIGQPGETLDDFIVSLRIALSTIDRDDPVPNIASIMPLLTFPGTELYSFAKNQGYFNDDEEYWERYGNSYRIDYNSDVYTDWAAGQAVEIAKIISQWSFHKSIADSLFKRLQFQKQFYQEILGSSHKSDLELLCKFLDGCLDGLE